MFDDHNLFLFFFLTQGLTQYLNQVLSQLASWLLGGEVQKVVIVICGVNTGETLERWAFNVETDKAATAGAGGVAKKSQKEISSGKMREKKKQL